jgi:hypothetical protein
MKLLTAALASIVVMVCFWAAPMADGAEWHSEQPVTGALGVPTNIGPIGDIEFWAPNRGVLITQGGEASPAGVYAYDGVSWHLYSTVCGGHEGRIAWEGPDSFWTVSDQRLGQGVTPEQEQEPWKRSLCHFVNGQVVASYAEPLGQPTSYLPINAAACDGPNDCWFAGERLPGTTNIGAFHLHWDGISMTAFPSLTALQPGLNDAGRTVKSLAAYQGRFYESVEAQEDDLPAPGESTSQPYLLHRIVPTSSSPFSPITTPIALGEGVLPWELEGLRLSTDGSQLWAVAGARGNASADPIALRLFGGTFSQLTIQGEVLAAGDHVNGVAAEPGSDHAWISYSQPGGEELARLAELHSDGTVDTPVELPSPADGIGRKGPAGPVACPAAGQCWMATTEGWLFHLGTPLGQDTDPAMHVLITTRPPDNGLVFQAPDELPPDDSGAEEERKKPSAELAPPKEARPHHRKPLVYAVHQHLDGTLLSLRFKLRSRAHVQLIAKRKRKVVANTKRFTMGRGPHVLHLRLDPDHWPTSFEFPVHAVVGPRFAVAELLPVSKQKKKAKTEPAAPAPPALATTEPSTIAAAAAAESAGGSPIAETVLGTPGVTFLGAAPAEAPGEVWGATRNVLYRYTNEGGWVPFRPLEPSGQPFEGFLSYGESGQLSGLGRTTPAGGVAVLGTIENEGVLVVRDPAGPARIAPGPGAALEENEVMGGSAGLLDPIAAFEAEGGRTGAFVAPARRSVGQVAPDGILRFDGSEWSREPICVNETGACQAPSNAIFQVLAIDATSESNAWMLARGENSSEGVVLFRRETGVWRRQPLEGTLGSLFAQGNLQFPQPEGLPVSVTVTPRAHGQPLTVTSAGVWIDVELTEGTKEYDGTLYYGGSGGSEVGTGDEVLASWCDLPPTTELLCSNPLGSELSAGQGRSFAWPPDLFDPYGRRVVTGIGAGAILSFAGSSFARTVLVGGSVGSSGGAALSSPTEGWLGGGGRPVRLTPTPQHANLLSWAVPFRRPLTAVAASPGAPVAGLGSEAMAVGLNGEVAHYHPGVGWQAESLLGNSGTPATPLLRAVAWPTAGFAYAVGDGGEMWLWRGSTGLWEPDPGKPPNLIRGNFTAIGFDPNEPARGYAIGQQGLLLGYGNQWTQEPPPAGISPEANFTSLAFAGGEALLTYSYPEAGEGFGGNLTGGVLVNDGAGWRVEEGAATALQGDVPAKVAALPDGGAVIVGLAGRVIEREGFGAAWQQVPETISGANGASGVAAVAAFREGGAIRAIVAGETSGAATPVGKLEFSCSTISSSPECEQLRGQPPAGQPPLLTAAYPSPRGGYLLRQTAVGWQDEQHSVNPLPESSTSGDYDLPRQPDPIAGLLVSTDGSEAWAVGGQPPFGTGRDSVEGVETAGVYRYPATAASPNGSAVAIAPPGLGEVALAVGGEAECEAACADDADAGIGPDVWLPHAIKKASEVSGLRAFLYTGPGVASRLGSTISPAAFGREEEAFATRLGSSNGVPVYAAPGESDLDATESLSTFSSKLDGLAAPQGGGLAAGVATVSPASPGQAYFSFDSTGTSGTVRVVVLDYSRPSLGVEQECWLAGQLSAAGTAGVPAIVVGNRDLAGSAPNSAEDASQVVPILVGGSAPSECPPTVGPRTGASAYFFDYPGQNRTYQLSSNGQSIPAFGSGTLGYAGGFVGQSETDYVGASGFMLASVNVAARNPLTNVAPVGVRLIPNIGELALDATDGTLLRRSSAALFEALARRPRAGISCISQGGPSSCEVASPDPYIPIPSVCQGAKCGSGVFPEYRFVSSDPEVANFVKVDPASAEPRAVLLGTDEKPIPDPTSGLLCAFNAGTTTVSIETGGLVYSTQVTVQQGSVARPCGTVPLEGKVLPGPETGLQVEPFPESETPEANRPSVDIRVPPVPQVHPEITPPTVPQPVPPTAHQPPQPPPPPQTYIFLPPAPHLNPIFPIVPPSPPPAPQPTPPSGTSPVTQPAVSPEPEKEEEAAFDLVHHMAAYRHHGAGTIRAFEASASRGPMPGVRSMVPALVLLLALAGVGAARSRRRPEPLAYESISTPRRSTK